MLTSFMYGPGQANLVVTTYASSEGSGDPAPRQNLSCSLKQARVKRNLQTESQIPGPSEWLGMSSWNFSWPGMLEDTNSLDAAHIPALV